MDLYDPHWDDVLCLVPFDDGHLRMPIDVKQQRTVFSEGYAACTTDVTLFGKSCGYTDGVNGRFYTAALSALQIGTNDFTIESWIYPLNGGAGDPFGRIVEIGVRDTTGSLTWTRRNNPNPLTTLLQTNISGVYTSVLPAPSLSIANGGWKHIAITRQGDTYREFFGGVLVGSMTEASGKNITGNFYSIGRSSLLSTEAFRAYHGQFRVTKSVARYTDTFTPPDGPFPQTGTPPAPIGRVSGTVSVDGVVAERDVLAITAAMQTVDDGAGGTIETRLIVGQTRSDSGGAYELDIDTSVGEVICLALDDYGTLWEAGLACAIGAILRPTVSNGYRYRCTVAGNTGATEPTWWITGAGAVGTATFEVLESWRPRARVPVKPDPI